MLCFLSALWPVNSTLQETRWSTAAPFAASRDFLFPLLYNISLTFFTTVDFGVRIFRVLFEVGNFIAVNLVCLGLLVFRLWLSAKNQRSSHGLLKEINNNILYLDQSEMDRTCDMDQIRIHLSHVQFIEINCFLGILFPGQRVLLNGKPMQCS